MPPPARRTRLGPALVVIHALALLALAASAIALWRTYCENFGCIGVGIGWFAWAVGYVTALAVGLLALRAAPAAAKKLPRGLLGAQLAAGACLLAYWASRAMG